MMGGPGPLITVRANLGDEAEPSRGRVRPGTSKRILPYTRPYRRHIVALLSLTALDAVITVSTPLLFEELINRGILPRDKGVVLGIALAALGLALLQALVGYLVSRSSARIGEGLIYDLRTEVFQHVQRQPLAFFTRAQTGSLVSRLNTDVMEAQQAVTVLLSTVLSSLLVLGLVVATIFYLSWLVGIVALVAVPFFVLPGRVVGRRLQRNLRESMQLDAELGSLMQERFNVAGALLVKLYGRPEGERQRFASRAARVRDVGVVTAVYSRMLLVTVTLLASLATAAVYGVGGDLVVDRTIQIGTLVALATLLARLFGPINQLSSLQSNYLTALVSFDRLFEVLDLKPLIQERPDAIALPADRTADIEFEDVTFRYPSAKEVSLASLETLALPAPERSSDALALRGVSFRAPAGKLTALVGPSGAGKTTISQLVARLYEPTEGVVRIGGHDVRDLTLASLHGTVGMVTQDAHMFHDTIRANLLYAKPTATEAELIEACEAAQVWDLINSLPNGLDTVVGDRGYRFSGGEKQRLSIARLLLKAPSVVVLDEATAHLDSESEAAVQKALRTALAGRTALVIAHRLSTIREADQILVLEAGRVVERGRHAELIDGGGLYADLYQTQFANPPAPRPDDEPDDASYGQDELPPLPPGGGPLHLLPPPATAGRSDRSA
ncbi:ABC transporter ATP-binding protein [Actinospica sp. MGRD01-02]|uniref:ABC transporter ATP-binding protein n=1 Tax=Actinospica acidithermotolerans TaxID=2828514 RepID=A0A941IK48_9ACTN|nr:ABC transporter ATP-binding protein [Actinospica acidithermotolerans]MBR7826376.1 ABC transporter ATP-binding protein [Actinospica acidithermotolerans]